MFCFNFPFSAKNGRSRTLYRKAGGGPPPSGLGLRVCPHGRDHLLDEQAAGGLEIGRAIGNRVGNEQRSAIIH